MKTGSLLLIVLAACRCFAAQEALLERTSPALITFKVKTDAGVPVGGVEINASTFLKWNPGEEFGRDIYQSFMVRTDADGIAVLQAQSRRGTFRYSVKNSPGYYRDFGSELRLSEVKDGRWEPWSATVEIVYKPIVNPVAMYAKKVGYPKLVELPGLRQPFGFDLISADWVAPYGRGIVSDLVFKLSDVIPKKKVGEPFEYRLTLSFSNEGDGILSTAAARGIGSELRLPRTAPETGYRPTLEKRLARRTNGGPPESDVREDQNYFLRLRTVRDNHGRIVSALYGKISGDIVCDVINSRTGYLLFTYYLNPEPLDRNMEFAPSQNRFEMRRGEEPVIEP